MTKFFKAVERETKEEIYFGLEDIVCNAYYTVIDKMGGKVPLAEFWLITNPKKQIENDSMKDWLKDYELFYQHGGEWFKYE